jgi:hypothetical protein
MHGLTPSTPVEIPVRSGRLIRTVVLSCVAFEALLVLLDYHVNYGHLTDLGPLRRLTNITREDSLASFFGTTQTLLISLTLWLVWITVRARQTVRWRRTGWLVLALFFSLMTVDDGAMLHERAGTVFSEVHSSDAPGGEATELGARVLEAFPSYAWQIVALPFFVALGIFLLVFLWHDLDDLRPRLIVASALVCFAIAVGMDFVEGLNEEHPWNLYTHLTETIDFGDYTQYRFRHDPYDTLRHFSKSIEEFLELLGNTLLWSVFLRRLVEMAPKLHIRFED